MLNANKIPHTGGGGSKYPKPEVLAPGAYPARIMQIISLGLQAQQPYKGEPKDPAYRLRVVYELADEFRLDEDGNEDETKPRWESEDFNLYSLESDMAKSTKRYLAIDPLQEHKGDWGALIGMPVTITLTTRQGTGKYADRTFNNVASVTAMREKEAAKLPELVNPSVVFDPASPDMEAYWKLPDFVTDKLKAALDYPGSELEKLVEQGPPSSEGGSSPKPSKAPEKAAESVSEPTEVEEEEDW